MQRNHLKKIKKIVRGVEKMEGGGVKVKRIIGSKQLPNLDPFLMMDHAKMNGSIGFPPHPHRGFETVSYIIKGSTRHEDFKGNYGELNEGGVQWMTAGRGIVHVEMPSSDEVEGFQIWVNLKSSDKLCDPSYQEKSALTIPKASKDGVEVTIIAGESLGKVSEIHTKTPAYLLDINLQINSSLLQHIPPGWNIFVYVIQGKIEIEGVEVDTGHAAVLTESQPDLIISSNLESRVLLLAGEPIGENIVSHGPFVMNTGKEIKKCIDDYMNGKNGFEGAINWEPRYITN
jgi:quercetin 2,3-dioxygenase